MRGIRSASVTLVLAALVAGCGADEEPDRAGAATPTATASRSAMPADLEGPWRVTLERADLPHEPPELEAGAKEELEFQVEFHATGGKEDGPSMTIVEDEETFVLAIDVSDGQVSVLDFVDCRTYPYSIEDERLTFETAHGGCVREHSLAAILASRPLRRGG